MNDPKIAESLKILTEIGKIQLNTFNVKNLKELTFVIVNDTQKVFPYHLAILFENRDGHFKISNVSGQSEFSKTGGFADKLSTIASSISNPEKPQNVTKESLEKNGDLFEEYCSHSKGSVFWQPIKADDGELLFGLWLENWGQESWNEGQFSCLSSLSDSYAAVAKKFRSPLFFKKKIRRALFAAGGILFLAAMFLPVSLRVVAPCEVLPKDPIYITAPIEGRIDSIVVDHGARVQQGDLLFAYEKELSRYQLEMKQKEHEIIQSKLAKAENQSHAEEESLKELQILKLEAEKAGINAELLSYQLSLMDVKSPINGVVEVDKPEQWRGRNVRVGEKVMMVYDDKATFVRISINFDDRIDFNWDEPVRVFLNPMPEKSYLAKLFYVSSFTQVNDQNAVVFIGEAEWIEDYQLKPGLQGSAILYGERVPLIYWLLRKPLNTLREIIGY